MRELIFALQEIFIMNDKIENSVIEILQRLLKLSDEVNALTSKEDRVKAEIKKLEGGIESYLDKFTRDNYKDIDKKLKLNSLSTELSVYNRLGYEFTLAEHHVVSGLYELVSDRVEEALLYFEGYIDENKKTKVSCDVLYLCGMINYNTADYPEAVDFFTRSAELHLFLFGKHDYQSEIYIAECMFLAKSNVYPQEKIDEYFQKIKKTLDREKETGNQNLDKYYITLYLKWGNCFFRPSIKILSNTDSGNISNITIDNQRSLNYYRKIIDYIGGIYHKDKLDDLLKVIMVYSLAQAMYSSRRDIDSAFARTTVLFRDVFEKLINLLLNKTENVILIQFYFMLGTCAYYSFEVPADQGLFYLENSRKLTNLIPTKIKIYSCMTKELLSRHDFVKQIDLCIDKIKSRRR
jgi:tetratricopeptide (TPR) repeat protein